MADWKTLSSTLVHKTPWIEIIEDKVLNQNGRELTYTYLHLPHPGVSVVAVNEWGEVLLQTVYRHTLKQMQWEIPSGHSDGQDPLVAAKRELAEEAELTSDNWVGLGNMYASSGVTDVEQILFLARNVVPIHGTRDEDEDISYQKFVPISEVKQMLVNQEIQAASTLVPLYRYLAALEAAKK